MNKRRIYLYSGLLVLLCIVFIFLGAREQKDADKETAKIALREVGHKLLLANEDTTSLVLPIVTLESRKYKLSFQNELSIHPDSLVAIAKHSFKKAELSEFYIVEVIGCTDNEVAYSYRMRKEKDKSIIPCSGRYLPSGCYSIEVKFINTTSSLIGKQIYLYILLLIVFVFLIDYFFTKSSRKEKTLSQNCRQVSIGSFQFYPEQNKLVKKAIEISLSTKECELLAIFVANPNQVIKRDEITKKVWEDKGVIVGRSLDTYISKLRKILKDDETIKLVNVHGVGYKLEIV